VSDRTPPETPAEALAEARLHARRATAELAVALRALVDAAALAADGGVAAEGRLAPVAEALEAAARWLDPERDEAGDAAAVLRALADGLDSEIGRWEARSREDAEARSVLRAFLAVREVLWELGTRFDSTEGTREAPPPEETPAPKKRRARTKRRVQRVAVEG
jgi:hypothetical protein